MVVTAVAMAGSSGGGGLTLLVPLALLAAFFWFVSRSQRKQRQRQQSVVASLQPGTRVITSSGLAGTVEAVEDQFIVLEVAPGVSLRFVPQAIGQVLDEPETALGDTDIDTGTDDDVADDLVADDDTVTDDDAEVSDDKRHNPPTHTEH
jgi:preprotein translocase subunit YajC